MPVEITSDAAEFEAGVGPLVRRELMCNMVATVLAAVRCGHYPSSRPVFAYALDRAGQPCLAALRTPPWPMLLGVVPEDLADQLVTRWLERDPEVPGVSGPALDADRVAAAWSAISGRPSTPGMRQAAHATREIRDPPRPAAGALRLAGDADRPLLGEWMAAFMLEALGIEDERVQRGLDAQMAERGLLLWEVDGTPMCLVGVRPAVEGVARIGPVYTPRELRGRGYGSSATAAASRRALAAGAHTCMLLTDLANPTSNKIYADIGYVRFADFAMHEFQ
jgi:predicted GNAT family acetyltransferase